MIRFTRLQCHLGWSMWINGKDWSVNYITHKLDTNTTIRINGWNCKATTLIPWVNLYKIKLLSPL